MLPFLATFLRRRRGVLGIALGLAGLAAARAQDQGPIVAGTMPEDYLPQLKTILQLAVKQSPQMIAQDINIAQQAAGRLQADSTFWPHVSGGASYAWNKEGVSSSSNGVSAPGQTSSSQGPQYNLGVSQTLFQWGQVIDSAKIARLGVLIAQKSYAQTYASLVVQIRDAYLQLVLKKIGLRSARYNLKLLQSALDVARAQVKSGAMAAAAIMGPEFSFDDWQLQVNRYEEDYMQSKRVCAHLAGLDDIAEEGIPDEMPKPTYSAPAAEMVLADLMRAGDRNSFQAQVYLMNIRQANLNYHRAQVNLLPQFSANAGISQTNNSSVGQSGINANGLPVLSVTQAEVESKSLSIGASWNIFDGFATRAQRLSALETRRSSENQLAQYVQQQIDQGEDLERLLSFDARAMDLSERRYAIQESALAQENDAFKSGDAPQVGVDNATYDLYASDAARAEARRQVFSRWSALVSLAGDDPALNNIHHQYVDPNE